MVFNGLLGYMGYPKYRNSERPLVQAVIRTRRNQQNYIWISRELVEKEGGTPWSYNLYPFSTEEIILDRIRKNYRSIPSCGREYGVFLRLLNKNKMSSCAQRRMTFCNSNKKQIFRIRLAQKTCQTSLRMTVCLGCGYPTKGH